MNERLGHGLTDWIEAERRSTVGRLDPERQAKWAQVFTASDVAHVMAAMVSRHDRDHWRVLDAGAGIGVLAGHVVAELATRSPRPKSIHVTAYEIDETLVPTLDHLLAYCATWAAGRGVSVTYEVRAADFLADMASTVAPTLTNNELESAEPYDVAILNPPYGKVNTKSRDREHARMLGTDVPNIYAAFWVGALHATGKSGDVIAITPRSFCNGTYFLAFRRYVLEAGWIRQMHVFDARHRTFADDAVLQESLITHVERGARRSPVVMTAQGGPGAPVRSRTVPADRVVREDDPDLFIHVVPDEDADEAAMFMATMTHSLTDLGLVVSTGPVVDFRCSDLLRSEPSDATVPLLYPRHVRGGVVTWPSKNGHGGASSSILSGEAAQRRLLTTDGHYVLVRRFSAKEEPRRVVAAWHAKSSLSRTLLGIENHLNYFHARGQSMDEATAIGLTIYLNSQPVDDYFRQFSGHTQVNATDLRSLRYPSGETLADIGRRADRSRLGEPEYFSELSETS